MGGCGLVVGELHLTCGEAGHVLAVACSDYGGFREHQGELNGEGCFSCICGVTEAACGLTRLALSNTRHIDTQDMLLFLFCNP